MACIDVVVPCYQYGRFLRDCVYSILNQGIDDLRILIIDNASTDDSLIVARQLAEEDRRIEIIQHKHNLGHIASLNEGVDLAHADYFTIVHADDLSARGSLKAAIAFLEQHPNVGFVIGKEVLFKDGEIFSEFSKDKEPQWRIFSGPEFVADRCRKLFAGPAIVRTAIQKRAGYYKEKLFFTCDIEMLLRLATFGDVGETLMPFGYRRLHGSNLANLHQVDRARDLQEFEAAYVSFFENEGSLLAKTTQLDQVARDNLVGSAYWWGLRDLTKGKLHTGKRLLSFAFARSKKILILPPIGFLISNFLSRQSKQVFPDT